MRFILHELYDLSWPLSGRSLCKNMYYCASSIYFLKEKQIHHVIEFSFWANRLVDLALKGPYPEVIGTETKLTHLFSWNLSEWQTKSKSVQSLLDVLHYVGFCIIYKHAERVHFESYLKVLIKIACIYMVCYIILLSNVVSFCCLK